MKTFFYIWQACRSQALMTHVTRGLWVLAANWWITFGATDTGLVGISAWFSTFLTPQTSLNIGWTLAATFRWITTGINTEGSFHVCELFQKINGCRWQTDRILESVTHVLSCQFLWQCMEKASASFRFWQLGPVRMIQIEQCEAVDAAYIQHVMKMDHCPSSRSNSCCHTLAHFIHDVYRSFCRVVIHLYFALFLGVVFNHGSMMHCR